MSEGGYFMYPNWGQGSRWATSLGGWYEGKYEAGLVGGSYGDGSAVDSPNNQKGGWFSGASCDCIDGNRGKVPNCTPFAGRRCKYVFFY